MWGLRHCAALDARMIKLFIISLFITFIVVRITAHAFHDIKNYGTRLERSKTITGLLRKKTGMDWHHIHLGFILLIILLISFMFYKLTIITTILFAISLSLIADQILPLLDYGTYFSKRMIIWAILLHLFIALAVIKIF